MPDTVAIKYNTMITSLPFKVEFSEFTPTDAKTTLGGRVTNQGDADKAVTLKIKFVDKSGNVVSTQDVPVGTIPAHKSLQFSATGTGAGIVAFRYDPENRVDRRKARGAGGLLSGSGGRLRRGGFLLRFAVKSLRSNASQVACSA